MSPAWSYLLHSLHLASLRGGPDYSGYDKRFDNDVLASCHTTAFATCVLSPDPSAAYNLTGIIRFSQDDNCGRYGQLTIKVDISGFPSTPSELHGFHIHTYGDLSNGCSSAGGHYNPFNRVHGDRFDHFYRRHVGDFGNLDIQNGQVVTSFNDGQASLFGTNNILGRAIVVHAGEDDLGRGGDAGSEANGNAGPRLACCVIGRAASQQ